MVIDVAIRGITPLLINKMDRDVLERLRTKQKDPKTKSIGSTLTPREDAERKLYLAEDGPYLPGTMLMSCLIGAGVFVRLDGKRQVSTTKSTVLPGLMSLMTPTLRLVVPGTDKAAPWEPDIMQGRNPGGGEAVALCRPRFDEWSFSCRIDIAVEEIGENTIRELWDKAGRRCGLGDFRPSRKGIYGQFVVECWEHVEE